MSLHICSDVEDVASTDRRSGAPPSQTAVKRQALELSFLIADAGTPYAIAQPVRSGQFINVLTGGTGGVYYPLGGALSNIFAAKLAGVKPSVQSTKGSVENLNILQQGRGELAFTLGDTLALAWAG